MRKILFTSLCGGKSSHDGLALLLKRNTPRLQDYCRKWGFELRIVNSEPPTDSGRQPGNPVWIKFGYYRSVLRGELSPGDIVAWVDSDTVLVRSDYDLTPSKDFAISMEPRGTWGAGVMAWRVSPFANSLIDTVWHMKDDDILPGLPLGWCDQPGIFTYLYSLSCWQHFRHVQIYPKFVNVTGRADLLPPEIFKHIVFRHFAGNIEIEWDWFKRPLKGL